jgi:hypothetical protein
MCSVYEPAKSSPAFFPSSLRCGMLMLRSLAAVVAVASRVGAAITKSPEPCAITYWFPLYECQLASHRQCSFVRSGDSYTTTGFDPNDTLPSVGNPLGNPAFPGETGGGGKLLLVKKPSVY